MTFFIVDRRTGEAIEYQTKPMEPRLPPFRRPDPRFERQRAARLREQEQLRRRLIGMSIQYIEH